MLLRLGHDAEAVEALEHAVARRPDKQDYRQRLVEALGAITKRMTDKNDKAALFTTSNATYAKQLEGLTQAKETAAVETTALRERLTRQFATMDARTAAYKSTQTFLDNQIKAWNRSDA